MSLMLLLHLALTLVTFGTLVGILLMRRAIVRGFGHGEMNRISAVIAETEEAILDIRREIRVDLDALHVRLEHLERLERERPS